MFRSLSLSRIKTHFSISIPSLVFDLIYVHIAYMPCMRPYALLIVFNLCPLCFLQVSCIDKCQVFSVDMTRHVLFEYLWFCAPVRQLLHS